MKNGIAKYNQASLHIDRSYYILKSLLRETTNKLTRLEFHKHAIYMIISVCIIS